MKMVGDINYDHEIKGNGFMINLNAFLQNVASLVCLDNIDEDYLNREEYPYLKI